MRLKLENKKEINSNQQSIGNSFYKKNQRLATK